MNSMATPSADVDRDRLASARALTLATVHAAGALEALAHASATSVRSADEEANRSASASLRALAESARTMQELFTAPDRDAPASPSASSLLLSNAGMTPSSALLALSRNSMAALPAIAAAAKTVAAPSLSNPSEGGDATSESAAAHPAFSRLAVQAALACSHFKELKSTAALHRVADIGPTMAQLGGALNVLCTAAKTMAMSMASVEDVDQDEWISSSTTKHIAAASAGACATIATDAPSISSRAVQVQVVDDSAPVLAAAQPAPVELKTVDLRASAGQLEAMRASHNVSSAKVQAVACSKSAEYRLASQKAATLESANRDLKAEMDSVRASLFDTQAAIDAIASKASAVDSLALDLDAARTALAVSQSEASSLRSALDASNEELLSTQRQLVDREARFDDHLLEHIVTRKSLESQLAAALEAASQMASENAAALCLLSDMHVRELESLRVALAKSQSSEKETRVKLTEAEARIEELEEELAFVSEELVFSTPAVAPKQVTLASAGVASAAPPPAEPSEHGAAVFAVGFLMGVQRQEHVRIKAAAQAVITQASAHVTFLHQAGARAARLAADAVERAEEAALDAEFARLEQIAAERKQKAAEAVHRARQQVLDEAERQEAERAAAEKRKLERLAASLKRAQDETAAKQAAKKAIEDLNPWKVVVNPTTMQVFYFNMQSSETSWDEPAGGAAPASDASTAAAMAALEAHALIAGSNSRELDIIKQSAELEAARARLPILRSWLSVKQGRGANAEWIENHFALVDFNLYFCRAEISVTDGEIGAESEIESIPLVMIEAIATKKNSADRVGRFDIKCMGDDIQQSVIHKIQCESNEERDFWVGGLIAHKQHLDALAAFSEANKDLYAQMQSQGAE